MTRAGFIVNIMCDVMLKAMIQFETVSDLDTQSYLNDTANVIEILKQIDAPSFSVVLCVLPCKFMLK